jgi:hypothetical protein
VSARDVSILRRPTVFIFSSAMAFIVRDPGGRLRRIWDMMFGTYVDPQSAEADFPLGLGEELDKKKIARMLVGV